MSSFGTWENPQEIDGTSKVVGLNFGLDAPKFAPELPEVRALCCRQHTSQIVSRNCFWEAGRWKYRNEIWGVSEFIEISLESNVLRQRHWVLGLISRLRPRRAVLVPNVQEAAFPH